MTAMPPIAIIAGGLATRMRPLTETIPKALLPIAGEPFIAHQLRLLRREGIARVVLCVSYLGEQIEAYAGNGAAFGLDIAYSYDGAQLVGTGGAVHRALPLLGEEFLVTYGDSYLDIPFAPVVDAFRAGENPALMTVFHNNGQWDTSNVEFAEGRIVEYSKQPTPRMRHIDYGLSVMTREAFAGRSADDVFDLALIFHQLVAAERLGGYEVAKRFYEIGSPSGMAETEAYLQAAARGNQR
jgi:N-acetyl-alpha-D-muramate 1-phosphate uridylyltransferase